MQMLSCRDGGCLCLVRGWGMQEAPGDVPPKSGVPRMDFGPFCHCQLVPSLTMLFSHRASQACLLDSSGAISILAKKKTVYCTFYSILPFDCMSTCIGHVDLLLLAPQRQGEEVAGPALISAGGLVTFKPSWVILLPLTGVPLQDRSHLVTWKTGFSWTLGTGVCLVSARWTRVIFASRELCAPGGSWIPSLLFQRLHHKYLVHFFCML